MSIGNVWGATFVEKWQNGKNETTKDLIANFTLGSNAAISSSRIQIGKGNTGSFTWNVPTGYTITSIKFVMNSTDDKVGGFTATNGEVTNTNTKEWTYTPTGSNISSETFTVIASGANVQVSEAWVTFTDGVSDAVGDYESIYPVSADSETPRNVTFTSSVETTSVTSITTENGVNNKCVQVANNKKVIITANKNIKYILFSWNKYAPSEDAKWTANTGTFVKSTYKWTAADATTNSVTFTRGESNTAEISNIHIVYYSAAPEPEGAYTIAATSASDAAWGTVAAAASKADEGEEVVITATPAVGYRVASWAVSGEGSDIDPKGNSHSNTTTLTVGSANATVTVTFEAIPTHNVTAATEDASKGSAVAAAPSVAEGATTTITATAEAGYAFDHWVVSGEGASLSSTSANPATLTMGTADATVTAYFVEKVCPTSGVIFSLAFVNSAKVTMSATETLELTSTYATISGGSASIKYFREGNTNKEVLTASKTITYGTNDQYLKLVLDCPLAPGDVIELANGSGVEINIATDDATPANATHKVTTTSKKYTVVADDALDGNSTFYLGRTSSNGAAHGAITITRPYAVTFVSDYGTAPATPEKAITLTLTELSDASHTHIGWKANKVVKVDGAEQAAETTLAVEAEVELMDNTTFTAVWEAKAATFEVTYKANNGTEEADVVATESKFAANTFTAPEGKMFAGWNTKDDGTGTDYAVGATVESVTIVYAKWVVDPTIRLILKSGDTYSINTDKFVVFTGTTLQDEEYTVDGRSFAKNFKFGGNCSTTPFAGQAWSNKFMAYDVTSNSTDIKLYIYNKNNGGKKLYYQIVPEGATADAFQSVTITSKATGQVVIIPTISAAKGARVLFGVESGDVRICQIEVTENGTVLPAFGTSGYEFSVPGRAATASKAGEFDGFEFKTNADLKLVSGQDYIALRNIDGSQYVKFTVVGNIQLQVTTSNTSKFYVSKTAAGDAEKDTQHGGIAATHNVNLHAGTYYIAPTASSSGGEVRITKLAFATAPEVVAVTFDSKGGSDVEAQEVFAGEKAVAPEAPTKDGYRFVKWQLSGEDYDFDEAVTTDITLDAVWQEVVTVTFDPANGEGTFTKQAYKDAVLAAGDRPADPEWTGYVFKGWWTCNADGVPVELVNLATETFSASATLKAVWEVAQTDATISALSYNGNTIDIESAKEVAGVTTYTVVLPWGSTIDESLITVTKSASTAEVGAITYDSEAQKATFTVTAGDGTTADYAIQFVIDARRGTSIIKSTTQKVVTGYIGGTAVLTKDGKDQSAATYKLDRNVIFGITLADGGTFKAGDVFIMNITAAPGSATGMGTMKVYDAAEATTPIYESTEVGSVGVNYWTLPAAAEGKTSLYIKRGGGNDWNPTFSYVEVTREMAPAIKSFTIGDAVGVIDESAKTIRIEVPYATDVTAMTPTVEAYGNNGATYTPAGETDFTSPVNYVVTDTYGESTTYGVTVTVAAASENANLASLSVAGYALDFDKETTTYNVVLDYGTTALPEITFAVEDEGLAYAAKDDSEVSGAAGAVTITVTPQAGEGHEKVYTIHFSVSTSPKFVIYDGSKTKDIASATGSDVSTGFSWSIGNNIGLTGSEVASSWNGKDYTYVIKGFKPNNNSKNVVSFTIPDNYMGKVCLVGTTNSSDSERSMFIAKEASRQVKDVYGGYIITSSTLDAQGFVTKPLLPGTYYLGSTDSYRLYELSVQLYPAYTRDVTEGRMGTVCIPNNAEAGNIAGAEVYTLLYWKHGTSWEDCQMIEFEQVETMNAGEPYLIIPTENKFGVVLGATAVADPKHMPNGFIGTFAAIAAGDNELVGKYGVVNNKIKKLAAGSSSPANRAYIDLSETPSKEAYEAAHSASPAPQRKRISLGRQSEEVATELDAIDADVERAQKIMIDGQIYIVRKGHIFTATGTLVK